MIEICWWCTSIYTEEETKYDCLVTPDNTLYIAVTGWNGKIRKRELEQKEGAVSDTETLRLVGRIFPWIGTVVTTWNKWGYLAPRKTPFFLSYCTAGAITGIQEIDPCINPSFASGAWASAWKWQAQYLVSSSHLFHNPIPPFAQQRAKMKSEGVLPANKIVMLSEPWLGEHFFWKKPQAGPSCFWAKWQALASPHCLPPAFWGENHRVKWCSEVLYCSGIFHLHFERPSEMPWLG